MNRSLSKISPASAMKFWEWWRVNLTAGEQVQLQAQHWLILEIPSNIVVNLLPVSVKKCHTCWRQSPPLYFKIKLPTQPTLWAQIIKIIVLLLCGVQKRLRLKYQKISQRVSALRNRSKRPFWNVMKQIPSLWHLAGKTKLWVVKQMCKSHRISTQKLRK